MANNDKINNKDIKSLQDINKSFISGMDSLYSRTGSVPEHSHELDRIGSQIDNIINSELNGTKSVTTDEMSTFLVKTFNDFDRNQNTSINSLDDIFLSKETGLEQFFQERYQNQNLLFDDLNMICGHLPELDEAVLTTRDAIITADDISKTVSRTITFNDVLDTDSNVKAYIGVINSMERDLKLPKKIKGQLITNLLKYGKYYVYTVPYEKLFEQQYKYKLRNPNLSGGDSLKESLTESACVNLNEVYADDTYYSSFKNELKDISKDLAVTESSLKESMEEYCKNITVTNDIFSIPLIEGTDVTQIMSSEEFKKQVELVERERTKNATKSINDGILDIDKKVEGKFKNIKGCYIKFIDPRRIVPIKILDTTLGYYYIHETQLRRDRAPFSTTIKVTSNVGSGTYADDIEAVFMQRITEKIVGAFDPKYVEKNQKFKDMILNALIYNDMYSKQINFQFIPAEYMTEFNIDEDEKGEGQSVLITSLSYAKLYLALLVFKIIAILTRSNDTRVYYVKNGGIDTNITNKINDVARSIKAKQINFMDLLNYNSIISKVGAFKDVFMPVGRSGERGIEFDTIAGQSVDWNSDIMEFLRTNMINATSVPSVIMEYINQADYARSITTGHIKFAGRTLNLQLDINPSITEMYQKILRFSNSTIPVEYIDKLVYTLNPPRALIVQNSSENISNADQLILSIIKTRVGDNDSTDEANLIKDIMYNTLAREYMPSYDWTYIDEVYRNAVMEAKKKLLETENNNE